MLVIYPNDWCTSPKVSRHFLLLMRKNSFVQKSEFHQCRCFRVSVEFTEWTSQQVNTNTSHPYDSREHVTVAPDDEADQDGSLENIPSGVTPSLACWLKFMVLLCSRSWQVRGTGGKYDFIVVACCAFKNDSLVRNCVFSQWAKIFERKGARNHY